MRARSFTAVLSAFSAAFRAPGFTWRWRRNPLRRRSDVLEAWAGVVAVVLMLVAGPVTGWTVGTLAHQALRETVREQRQHRHLVSATTVRSLADGIAETDHESTAGREGYHRVVARWPGPDGKEHTGAVAVRQPGDGQGRFPLWTDDRGRVAGRPLDDASATVHATLAGAGAAVAVGWLLEAARRLTVRRITHRRYERWDRAWERAGHTWGRADAGS
ncbi:hypothetical protein FHS39_002749 [Streptomyces olivoverticillatus]|uniref:Integral membrane protein n=1 Tax=Streptomyces olivoverticillatus TaxID=66427 RepID=A0A7W7PLS7_9ACTN|nr:hypothetical protein [Streptomyces olivoverticillatus]